MKNKFIKTTILLSILAVTLDSCRKKDPPAETISTSNNGNSGNSGSSGNNGGNTNNNVNGCTDIDSPLYNSSANTDDGSCKYAYTSSYEITYHPEQDNGSNWDYGFGNSTRADLILKIKEQGSSNYIFEGEEKTNQEHNVPAIWNAQTPVKLLNKTYEWELVDYDATSTNDLISSGTFNPITLANNGTITTTAAGSQLKITYTLQ